MNLQSISEAFIRVLDHKKPCEDLIIHTYRGLQNTSNQYAQTLGFKIHSFSGKGKPWDNKL